MLIAQLAIPVLDMKKKVSITYHGLSSTDGNSQCTISTTVATLFSIIPTTVFKIHYDLPFTGL